MTAEPARAAEPGALSRRSRARRWPRLLGAVLVSGVTWSLRIHLGTCALVLALVCLPASFATRRRLVVAAPLVLFGAGVVLVAGVQPRHPGRGAASGDPEPLGHAARPQPGDPGPTVSDRYVSMLEALIRHQ